MTTLVHSGHVHANGIRQHFLRYRARSASEVLPSVVLLPGITSPAVTWGFVAERLGSVFDVFVLDIRGRGLSESGDGLDYSLDAQAADVLAFTESIGIDRYSIVGHSMGARIAARAGRTRPAKLDRLVLVDPPVSGPGRRPYPMQLSWYLQSIERAARGMSADEMREYCPTWSEDHLSLRAEWLHTCDPRAITESFNGFANDDFHGDLPHIEVPTLLVTAARGDVVRDVDVAEIREAVPDLIHRSVHGAGHMIPWDDEAGFHVALGDFLGAAIPTRIL
ncbi:alpha/beta fold hydrolase [Variovorax saccharolyticus]|uniref:alpha/beta fold hydrolase n=1 Tax=Variovorax saccharolyticus TaxID=3053516 RepID=UPI00257842BF|nr:alpha/beta hydrolase [Variovorax sp. J22R187]MDM0021869.1 alpha/beta hydrolase [Variovorax sp. J22R187]